MNPSFPPFDYESARTNFSFAVAETFNFAFDVVGQRARSADKTALIAINRAGDQVNYYRYSDLEKQSNRFANALLKMGVRKGDTVLLVLPRIPAWYFVILAC
ncbi:MAG: acyl-CoA synthetase, partial [Betaproteobacteria bacterium]|nr:acyl-CoA synthetase [Betaproteobacteria bacterium]